MVIVVPDIDQYMQMSNELRYTAISNLVKNCPYKGAMEEVEDGILLEQLNYSDGSLKMSVLKE